MQNKKSEKVNIQEKDIFNFIFSPFNLNDEKFYKISEQDNSCEMQSFYTNLRIDLFEDVSLNEKKKLSKLIPDYTF